MSGTIMIAANDPNIIYLLRRYAEESGFETVNVSRGEDVLPSARQTMPDVIILEMDLPGMSGEDILYQLQHQQPTCQIPIVLYSWLNEESQPHIQGVSAYLQESALYEDFLDALTTVGIKH